MFQVSIFHTYEVLREKKIRMSGEWLLNRILIQKFISLNGSVRFQTVLDGIEEAFA